MLEQDYKRFRNFNKIYWIIAAVIVMITLMMSAGLGAILSMVYMEAEADSELAVVFFIFMALIAVVIALLILMLISVIVSLPYVIFNGIHLYKFHSYKIPFDSHMVFALVMTIIFGYYDAMSIFSLSANIISSLLTVGVK